jgi:glycosyltransferase involved in cell wall biosynthesis
MKIHFDNVSLASRSGPNTFASRLAKALFESGNEVVTSCDDSTDVSLVFIEPSGQNLCRKGIVQRLDGIWFKPNEYHTKNISIKSLYDRANTIVFQSQFDKTMIEKLWGVKEASRVIGNGINQHEMFSSESLETVSFIRKKYDLVFSCSANWHKQKRLRANIEAFDHIRNNVVFGKRCALIIMGANPDVSVSDPNIFFTGSQPADVFMPILSISDWFIHLAWADHCPNVVVEALSQGVPVICGEVGGTKELVGDYGIVLKESAYDFGLFDYDHPPAIDVSQVVTLPSRETLDISTIKNIDIKETAKEYIDVFKGLIKQ